MRPADFIVHDQARQREIPIRIYLPADHKPAAVVIFSHGLGGTRENSAYLGKHWSARGYAVVFLQHPGSDDSVWRNQPMGGRMTAMNQAASGKNFMLRVKDVPAVLDRLSVWNKDDQHPCAGRLDLSRVGMCGHSFGAVTTQAVSGQAFAGSTLLTDPRIRAAIAFSPSSPQRGDPSAAFGSVRIPWMLMTGTKDISIIGNTDLASRFRLSGADRREIRVGTERRRAFRIHRPRAPGRVREAQSQPPSCDPRALHRLLGHEPAEDGVRPHMAARRRSTRRIGGAGSLAVQGADRDGARCAMRCGCSSLACRTRKAVAGM
jgi:predicted dienelactone hydrolase